MVLQKWVVILEGADVDWVLPIHHEAQKEVELFVHDSLEDSGSESPKPVLRHQGFEVPVVGSFKRRNAMAVHKVPLDLVDGSAVMVANLARELFIPLDMNEGCTWRTAVSGVLSELPGSLVGLLAHQAFYEIWVPRELFQLVLRCYFCGKVLCWNVLGQVLLLSSLGTDSVADFTSLLSELLDTASKHGLLLWV